jgi:uncharacterized membrane protein (UPF0127 family)
MKQLPLLVVLTTIFLAPGLVVACRGENEEDEDAYEHVMSFDTARVRLARASDTIPLHLELAVKSEQKSMGLMERRHLDENAGMLFVYDSTQPPDAGFWMYRTRIPLDIAFADSAGVIRSIRSMVPARPPSQRVARRTPDVPYRVRARDERRVLHATRRRRGNTLLLTDLPPATARKP